MSQPEPPIDPPNIDTPVDQVEVIQSLLRDVDHELNKVDVTPNMRAVLRLSLETLASQLEVLQ